MKPEQPFATSLSISLGSIQVPFPLSSGRNLLFTHPILVVRNGGDEPVEVLGGSFTAWREREVLFESSEAVGERFKGRCLEPGGEATVDLYALMGEADRGFASRVHLFGVKALLEWWFRVSVEVRGASPSAEAAGVRSSAEFTFRWRQPAGSDTEVLLEVQGR